MNKRKPNVVFMFVDDLGYGDVSCFNKESKISTPNIDMLAREGMSFTDSHACSALCTPSRYGLLTGRYPWRSRLKQFVLTGDSETLIEHDRMTMAHVFKEAGYKTACVGKWHLGLDWTYKKDPRPEDYGAPERYYENMDAPCCGRNGEFDLSKKRPCDALDIDYEAPIRFGPNQYGFDYFFGIPGSLDAAPFVYIENDRVLEVPDHISGEEHLDRHTASMQTLWEIGPAAPGFDHKKVIPDMNDKVLELLESYAESEEPFFIYYPTPAVHGPLLPTEEFEGKSGLNLYADVVLQLDDMVGQLHAKLEELGLAEDTIFVFTSDNGCSGVADYPLLLSKGHNPSAHFRGMKADIYEGGHRVPTIIRYPGQIQEGAVCDETVCHTDFFRTFAQLLGVSVADDMAEDSVSNLPLWGTEGEYNRKNVVYASGASCLAIKKAKWKLALCEGNGGFPDYMKWKKGERDFQLFDMEADPGEKNNLAAEKPELILEMEEELKKLL